jgi:large subunit ribosomal protein L22
MEYKTILRYARNTPRKMRYVADMIRNKPVPEAQRILKYTPKRVSYFLYKLVNSALANATNRDANLTPEDLLISEISVGDGPAFKRWRSASMGRATQVKKRTSHVTLVLKTITQPAKSSRPAGKHGDHSHPEAAPKHQKTTVAPVSQPAGEKENESKTK